MPSFAEVQATLRPLLADVVPGEFKLQTPAQQLELTVAKYGFLDLTFNTSDFLLNTSDKISRKHMRDLGLSQRLGSRALDPDSHVADQLSSDRSCLEVLIESISETTTFLLLFLSSKWSDNALQRFVDEVKNHPGREDSVDALTSATWRIAEKSHAWLPITFFVEDACLTNCDAIWLAKHQYL